jgi:ubiquinone/menaquinone biosynthesis C-methylase UbiE
MDSKIASLLTKQPVDCFGMSFFDLPKANYAALAAGMADENRWHFENNNAESHMAYLRGHGRSLVDWSARLPFPQGSVHLDVGAGEGILSYILARRGYHSLAVELSATILHSATLFQTGLDKFHLHENSSMHLWVADIYNLPLKTASVDFVTIKQILHHLEDLDRLMQEVSRVLKPNGMVYIWEPFFPSFPPYRWYILKRTKPQELALGIHHVHHTYWRYQQLCSRWLVKPTVRRNYTSGRLYHFITQNRFGRGEIYVEGSIQPYRQLTTKPSERLPIRPQDFLHEDLLTVGLETTRLRKEYLDSLLEP